MTDWPLALWLVAVAGVVLVIAWLIGYLTGRWQQQAFDVRYFYRKQETMMADFTLLTAEVAKLIAYVQAPRPEDPAIQAEIDRLAAEVKAVNDQVAPPAAPSA